MGEDRSGAIVIAGIGAIVWAGAGDGIVICADTAAGKSATSAASRPKGRERNAGGITISRTLDRAVYYGL